MVGGGLRGPKGAVAAGPSVTRLVPPTFVDNSKRAHRRNTYVHIYIAITQISVLRGSAHTSGVGRRSYERAFSLLSESRRRPFATLRRHRHQSIRSARTRRRGGVHGPCRERDCLRTLKGARGDSGGGGERTMFINAVYGTHIFHGHSKRITWWNNAFKNIKRPFGEVYTNQVYLGLCGNMYVYISMYYPT